MHARTHSEIDTHEDQSSSIGLIGDVALNGLFCSEKENNAIRFMKVSRQLDRCNLVIANLETPVIGKNKNFNRRKVSGSGILHYTERNVLSHALNSLNLSAVTLANNHIFDCGLEGLEETIACLDENGVIHTGAGLRQEHIMPVYFEMDGIKVGIIAYVDRSTNPCIIDTDGVFINYYDKENILRDIINTKINCDKLILSLHWGPDYSYYPYKYQRTDANTFIQTGVDTIIGHHSHTVQPYEVIDNRLVFYSLGSLCYGDFVDNGKLRALRRKTKIGLIPIISSEIKLLRLVNTCELKGNNIVLIKKHNYKLKFYIMTLIHRSKIAYSILLFKEAVFDRLIDYFFGYYRNPFKQLIAISNLKKLTYMKQDLHRGKSR